VSPRRLSAASDSDSRSAWYGDLAPADLRAVRTAIGAELRRLYSDVLREEIPDRMAELLKRLDQPKEAGPRAQDIDKP
jgi:hypothetical protein